MWEHCEDSELIAPPQILKPTIKYVQFSHTSIINCRETQIRTRSNSRITIIQESGEFYVTILETITKKFESTKQQNLCFIYIHLFFLAFSISYLKLSRSLMSLNILLINKNFRSISDTYRARVCMSVTDGPEREELRRNNNKCFIVTVYND